MIADKTPRPVAVGNFSKTPFAHILVYLWEQKKGGTLKVTQGDHNASVYFREGTPAKIISSVANRDLKAVLIRLGFINDEQVKACEEEFERTGGLFGQILVRQGAIDTPTLIRALREQMLLKLTDIFAMTKGSYEFYEKINMIVGFGPDELFPVDPYPVLMAGLRVHNARLGFGEVLRPLEGKWISTKDPETIRRFRLNKAEKAILEELLANPQEYNALVSSDSQQDTIIRYVIYVLMITKNLVIEDAGPAQPEPEFDEGRPSKLDSINPVPNVVSEDPEIIEKKNQILEKATTISSQNYYEMLELSYGAPDDEVRTAFFKMAKLYHPDKVPREISDELKDTLQYIFSNLSEAHATLVDPDAREEYEAAIKDSMSRTSLSPDVEDDQEEVRKILEAENHYQKAMVFLKRNQLDKAKELVDKALKNNPKESEYVALWAHLEGKMRAPHEDVDDLLVSLRESVESHPKSERIHLFLAQMLKRAGHENESRLHFHKVLELNPRNIEAAREIRIIDMRKKSDEKRQSGFFKKFFG